MKIVKLPRRIVCDILFGEVKTSLLLVFYTVLFLMIGIFTGNKILVILGLIFFVLFAVFLIPHWLVILFCQVKVLKCKNFKLIITTIEMAMATPRAYDLLYSPNKQGRGKEYLKYVSTYKSFEADEAQKNWTTTVYILRFNKALLGYKTIQNEPQKGRKRCLIFDERDLITSGN